ncbi:MAG: hypothetical protein HOJ19_05490, partial [Candidatus Marinimicrobia bacterium]|nr:hypothetical protein [Candidatus Neomarinimicrobiota bacterium]MBT5236514.1 hypothetical protein [Candidatus Neomarinimicrobiota bacterium]MBT6302774.1 hypothetical protein [Candidatus Neomarinimicrobiota bacterium]
MFSTTEQNLKYFVKVSILLILLLSMGFADFDADGVDLVGRYTYGYCPNVQARGEYVYSSNGT